MMIVMPNRSTDFVVCIFIFLACCYISASVPSCKVYQSTHVDCTYRDLTSVPRHLPSSTTHLDLSYNHIANLLPRDFENLHSLEELTMWIADDLHIDSGTFVGLQRLRLLRFLGNGYLTFGKETFKHLSSLQTLESPIKSVTYMPEYVFSNLTNLSKLSIRVPAQVRADYTLLTIVTVARPAILRRILL
ncbi:leucine-rich repeat and immunoglobulin-like domain-containing nogo receptor-interacting protein 3 [Ptychodera flava]|uniref:leucine-rich repeat and immunoglobulin-like domain-containing nogo receptor-interacting protein 3 n=1 Tax=Ptychodera flava TaxID=63121 RepID=UPI00396A5D65